MRGLADHAELAVCLQMTHEATPHRSLHLAHTTTEHKAIMLFSGGVFHIPVTILEDQCLPVFFHV